MRQLTGTWLLSSPKARFSARGGLVRKKRWFWINVFNVCWIMLSGFYGFLYGVLGCLRSVDCFFMLFPCFLSVLFFMFVECFMDSWISSLASYLDTIKRPHLVVMESIEIVDLD